MESRQRMTADRGGETGTRYESDARALLNLRRDVHDGLPAEPSPRATRAARALGWFSIALGVAEFLAPRTLSRVMGLGEDYPRLIPLMGFREIATGWGILASEDSKPWLWMRVAGDAVDLSLLGAALADDDSRQGCVLRTTAAVSAVTALDIATAVQHTICE